MSLINDALRRASQSDKERPRPVAGSMGMEPTPVAQGSRLNIIIAAVAVVVVLLAGWFFWQWWHARSEMEVATAAIHPAPAAPRVIPQPVVPKPAPVVAVAAPKPAPVLAPVPVVAPAPAPVAPVPKPAEVAPAGPLPNVANFSPTPWPVDLKLGGIFYRKDNPRALINGSIYGVGDEIQGVIVKKIEQTKVTVEYNGRNRTLTMGGS